MNTSLRVLCSFLLVLQASPPVSQPQSATPSQQTVDSQRGLIGACQQPCLEDGTPVRLRISQTVSSADAHVDDRVEFEVLEDVRVSDVLVIPKGGIALGTVTEAQPKRRMARGGKLEIVMDSVRLTDGEKAALRATKEVNGGGHTGAMTAGIVATGLIFFPAAPFFLFMHGKDITIAKGTEVPTFVNGNLHIDLAKFQTSAPAAQASVPPGTPAQVVSATGAEISVVSTPPGADIELDGIFVGTTPAELPVSAGQRTIKITKNGFAPFERRMLIVAGGKQTISADLQPGQKADASISQTSAALGFGTVSISSDPSGAEIYADDSLVGKTPTTIRLTPGTHWIRILATGYKNWTQQVTVATGAESRVAINLEKSD